MIVALEQEQEIHHEDTKTRRNTTKNSQGELMQSFPEPTKPALGDLAGHRSDCDCERLVTYSPRSISSLFFVLFVTSW